MDDSSFEAQWRRRFDEFARTQDSDASIAGWSATGLETRVRTFLHHWQPRALGERWLDLGCGAGTYSRLLAEQGLDVVGADYSHSSLSKARSRAATPIYWLSADARRLPFPDCTFDGILCFGVTQALSETLPAAAEAARVLRPGGELWIDALNGACIANVISMFSRRFRGMPAHLRYERANAVARALKHSGFHVVDVYWLPIAPTGYRALQAFLEAAAAAGGALGLPALSSLLSHSFIVRARR